jgi:type IV secretory pathway VirB4 component
VGRGFGKLISPHTRRPPLRATTRHLQAAYPFMAESGLGTNGIYIGSDAYGGAFTYDPFVLYEQGYKKGANLLVMGEFGMGKSAFCKAYALRQLLFGRIVITLDAKHEYDRLAEAFGVQPVALEPGGQIRLNPLDPRGSPHDQLSLLAAISEAVLSRGLDSREYEGLRVGLEAVALKTAEPTIPQVVEGLLDPSEDMAAHAAATDPTRFREEMRDTALALRRLCEGDLAGMFDGPTSKGVDFDSQLVVLDVSSLLGKRRQAFSVLMACATAWVKALVDDLMRRESAGTGPGRKIIVMADEAWRALSEIGVGEWLQESFKLGRSWGVQNVVVVHRLSDLRAVGAEGSREVRLAEGLLSDAPTRVCFSQSPTELREARELLDLTETETSLLSDLGTGEALWKIAGRSFLVRHHLSPTERYITDTDMRMRL